MARMSNEARELYIERRAVDRERTRNRRSERDAKRQIMVVWA